MIWNDMGLYYRSKKPSHRMIWMIDIKTSKDGVNNGDDGNLMI